MSTEQSFFVLADSEKCTGCRACELACFAGHLTKKDHGKKTQTVGTLTSPVTPRLFLARGKELCMPVQCHHCEDAPCLRSCLPGAISREDGVVVLDARKCIGCRNCAIACPFGAIQVYSPTDLPEQAASSQTGSAPKFVYKCDLCKDAKEPACAAACPNKALRLVNPAAEIDAKRINAINVMGAFAPETQSAAASCCQAQAQEGGK